MKWNDAVEVQEEQNSPTTTLYMSSLYVHVHRIYMSDFHATRDQQLLIHGHGRTWEGEYIVHSEEDDESRITDAVEEEETSPSALD